MRGMINAVGEDGYEVAPTVQHGDQHPHQQIVREPIPAPAPTTEQYGSMQDQMARLSNMVQKFSTNDEVEEFVYPVEQEEEPEEELKEQGEHSLEDMAPTKDSAGRPQHNRSNGSSFQQNNGWLG